MDAIVESPVNREAELTALARLVIYAQAASRDLGAHEVESKLAESLLAIVRELEDPSSGSELQSTVTTAPTVATCQ